MNLSLAIRAAVKASGDAPACIAFGGSLMPAIRATKAQAEDLRAFRAERDIGLAPSGVPSQLLRGSNPVSYTHLDVYKRQVQILDLFRYEPRLVVLRVSGEPDQLRPVARRRKEVLLLPVKVVADHRVRRGENVLGREIVLLELHDPCPDEVALKLDDVATVSYTHLDVYKRQT